jgi:hypothetical protein
MLVLARDRSPPRHHRHCRHRHRPQPPARAGAAAIFGGQFEPSGFRFDTSPILSGSYGIVIRMLSAPGGLLVASRSIRVDLR